LWCWHDRSEVHFGEDRAAKEHRKYSFARAKRIEAKQKYRVASRKALYLLPYSWASLENQFGGRAP
jgi:hypothetical protein